MSEQIHDHKKRFDVITFEKSEDRLLSYIMTRSKMSIFIPFLIHDCLSI